MNPKSSELATAVAVLRPYFMKAFWFSVIGALLILAPTCFMMEVYDRLVISRNHFTMAMLVLLVLFAIARRRRSATAGR